MSGIFLFPEFLLQLLSPFVDASLDCSHWDAEDVRYLLVGVAECVHDDRTDADAPLRCSPHGFHDLLLADEGVGMDARGRLVLWELLDEPDALLPVELVDVDVLHHLVGEASECVPLFVASARLPEPCHGVADKVFDVRILLAVPACHFS